MSLFAAVAAFALHLHSPIDCTLGKDCFIQNYVDEDNGPGWRDFTCGHLTYEGHKGTDFRLVNQKQMDKGVDVLAAADGEVVSFRDGMADISIKDKDANPHTIKNLECGNGVLLKHAGGIVSQYCHMKKGSLKVKVGQKMQAGDVLGQVGLSGQTEFPHVHFELRTQNGSIIDPFAPNQKIGTCHATQGKSAWRAKHAPRYLATGMLQAGWTHTIPTPEEARAGKLDGMVVTESSPALIVWAELFGLNDGDELQFEILGPTGQKLVKHAEPIKGNKAVFFQFVGQKQTLQRWQNGDYQGIVSLWRGGKIVQQKILKLTL